MSRVTHYWDGKKWYSMPKSGIHIKCACGKTFQKNFAGDAVRWETNIPDITCKNCLAKLGREKNK